MYPAKIILFGEHTVLQGGRALAVPYPTFGVRWEQGDEPDKRLLALLEYLQEHFDSDDFNFPELSRALQNGWQLIGNVPGGYGLGSSGTVCAAIYDRFGRGKMPLSEVKAFLARMEGFYHGQSSGTDPLISLLKEPLLLERKAIRPVKLRSDWNQGLVFIG